MKNIWYVSFLVGIMIGCGIFVLCLLIKEKDVEFMEQTVLIRHGAPTKYDEAALGTICKVMNNNENNYDLYIQYSSDDANPKWEYMGNFNVDDEHLCQKICAIKATEDPK